MTVRYAENKKARITRPLSTKIRLSEVKESPVTVKTKT